MKVNKFRPSSKEGSILGEMEVTLDVPVNIVCKVVRNKSNGSLFISLPSEKYINKNGETKYKNLAWFDKDIQEKVNKELIVEYNNLQNKDNNEQHLPF